MQKYYLDTSVSFTDAAKRAIMTAPPEEHCRLPLLCHTWSAVQAPTWTQDSKEKSTRRREEDLPCVSMLIISADVADEC